MHSARLRDHTAPVASNSQWIRLVRHVSAPSVLAIAIGLGAFAVQPAAANSPQSGGAGFNTLNPGDEEDKWIDEFMEILRRIYEALGGDPRRLGNTPAVAMLNVSIRVTFYGVPTNLTSAQADAVIADIDTLTEMLEDPPSSVDPGSFSTVLAGIVSELI